MNLDSTGTHGHGSLPDFQDHPSSSARSVRPPSSRREFIGALAGVAAAFVAAPFVATRLRAQGAGDLSRTASAAAVAMKVYKDPGCGCCKEWIKHMQKAGFAVTFEDTRDMDAVKVRLGVPATLGSCHTAVVGDYLVEGHVPADVVQKLLAEKPNARGLAVPGMPQGSPGMEGPTKDKYQVMLFDRLGKATVYASR